MAGQQAHVGMKIDAESIAHLAEAVAAGNVFYVSAAPPTGYTRQFQHQDWVDFVDPVQAGGNNGLNGRFHGIEHEFDLIAAAIASVDGAVTTLQGAAPAIGLTLALSLSNGASIPVPTGFQASDCKFFAFAKRYTLNLAQAGNGLTGFAVYADQNGKVTATVNGKGQGVMATGLAIAKKGGW